MIMQQKEGCLADILTYSEQEYKMHVEGCRFESFKDWPFDESCACNPRNMAKAGFYHIPTNECPDGVRCFFCFKELDGWEPDDDPMKEHKKHSSECAFIALKKPYFKNTMQKFLQLEMERQKNKVRKSFSQKVKEIETVAIEVRRQLCTMK